jgi:type II secretory pathway component PulF
MTIEDLIALNDEISSLVRAGVPLEAGLAELGGDLPGRLGQFAAVLAQRTARGESLAQAISGDAKNLPPAYRAVVEAGVRAGRLPAALESVAASTRRLSETSRAAVIAASYPMLVILTAWCGLIFFTTFLAPRLAITLHTLNNPVSSFFDSITWIGHSAWLWGPIMPILLVLIFTAWWLSCTRVAAIQGGWTESFLGRLPWMGRLLRLSRTATFLDVLALLVESETPLPEAVVLAAEASGDPQTLRTARQVSIALQSGQMQHASTFPPLVNWLLLAAGRDGALLSALRNSASAYHRRARRQSDAMRVFLPIFLTVVVAGGVTTLYALALFIPYTTILYGLR